MCACAGQNHPQVPKTILTISLNWCHDCSAWTIYSGRHTNTGSYDPEFDMWSEDYLGPFDGTAEAIRVLTVRLDEMLSGSGVPWDLSAGWKAVDPDR